MGKLGERLRRAVQKARRVLDVVIGLAFLFLAGTVGEYSFELWKQHQNHPQHGLATFDLAAGFTVALIIFSLYSFARARSVR